MSVPSRPLRSVRSPILPAAVLLAALLAAALPRPALSGAAAPPGAPPDRALFDALEKFHGHSCAGSLFGARMGHAAREALKAAGGAGKLKALYLDHSCPVDGIQVAAGTTYGNRAISVEDRDEARLVLTAEGNGKKVEARLSAAAEERGKRSRELGKKGRSLPAGSPERVRLEGEVEAILEWFRTAPTAEVLVIE